MFFIVPRGGSTSVFRPKSPNVLFLEKTAKSVFLEKDIFVSDLYIQPDICNIFKLGT